MSEDTPSSTPPDPIQQFADKPPVTFDPNLFPSRHRPWWQFLLDHNPCLLLSTAFMLLGCYLVNAALSDQDQSIKRIGLLAVINVYEACIIPLGLVLIRRTRGVARDGWWLLLFEILFLTNATFINVDLGRSAWSLGFLFNGILFALACLKAAIVFRGLRIGLHLRTFGFFALQLGIIYGLPIFFALVDDDGVVSPRIMYGCWWFVGLLPVLYDLIARFDRQPHEWGLVQQVIRRVYLIAPWIILLIHLRFSHWAHYSDFTFADLAPVLLGLAIASTRMRLGQSGRAIARALPIFACLLTLSAPAALEWSIYLPGADSPHLFTALHLVLPTTILTYGYMASMFALLVTASTLALVSLGYMFQHWILATLYRLARWIIALFPTTLLAWGVVTIITAYLLLAIGSFMSLRRIAPSRGYPT